MTKAEYILGLRASIIDVASVNRLLKFDYENDDAMLGFYIEMALSKLNSIMPMVLMYAIESFPFSATLIHAAMIECLLANGIFQARNSLDYNNSGISVKIMDGQRYNSQLQMLLQMSAQEFDQFRQYKINYNIEGCYGAVPSPYAQIGGRIQP